MLRPTQSFYLLNEVSRSPILNQSLDERIILIFSLWQKGAYLYILQKFVK